VPVSYDFTGRTALITAGAGDMGAAVARRILAAGGRGATFDLSGGRATY
jgi:2-dehydro-3-deoxy-L-rhamnonate dehydrogenase (NAD+)